jgi:hypothetical protein
LENVPYSSTPGIRSIKYKKFKFSFKKFIQHLLQKYSQLSLKFFFFFFFCIVRVIIEWEVSSSKLITYFFKNNEKKNLYIYIYILINIIKYLYKSLFVEKLKY